MGSTPPRKRLTVTIRIDAHDTYDLEDQLQAATLKIPHRLDQAIADIGYQQTGEVTSGSGASFAWRIRDEDDYTPKDTYDTTLASWRQQRRDNRVLDLMGELGRSVDEAKKLRQQRQATADKLNELEGTDNG